jgi:hypothetical protein
MLQPQIIFVPLKEKLPQEIGVHACKRKQNWWHQPHATLIETKRKSINHKPNIKIKFQSHHSISDNKNFETRSHLTIFWQTLFYSYF